MSLYEKYILEREGARVIKNDHAFVAFKVVEDAAFILNIYVEPEFRKSGLAKMMVDEAIKKSIDMGAKSIFGDIYFSDPNRAKTLATAIALGFDLFGSDGIKLVIFKDISGGK